MSYRYRLCLAMQNPLYGDDLAPTSQTLHILVGVKLRGFGKGVKVGLFGSLFGTQKQKPKDQIDWNRSDIGELLSTAYDEYCTGYADCCSVAWNVYTTATSQYIVDVFIQKGASSNHTESPVAVPRFLQAFLNANERDEEYVGPKGRFEEFGHDVVMMTEKMTEQVGDADLRLKVIYAIADAVIRKHNLNRG